MQAALIGSLLLVVVTWVVMATGVGSAPSMRSPRNLADVDALAGRVVASRNDPLLRLRVEWLADDRPAYETIDAFEADVERVLSDEAIGQEIVRDLWRGGPRPYATDLRHRVAPLPPPPPRKYDAPIRPQFSDGCSHSDWDGDACRFCGTRIPF